MTAIAWTTAVVGASDARSVQGMIDVEREWDARGGTVFQVAFAGEPEPGAGADRISRSACEAISEIPGVAGAVALAQREEPVRFSQAPGRDLTAVTASADIWTFLGIENSPYRGIIVPSSQAERLGLHDGDSVVLLPAVRGFGGDLPGVPVSVTVADLTILGEEFGGVIFPELAVDTPENAGRKAVCLIRARDGYTASLRAALPALLAASNATHVLDRLSSGPFPRGANPYGDRVLAHAWLPIGGLLGLLWMLVQWLRRGQDALYATLGADRGTRALIRVTEWGALSVFGAAWGVTLGFVLAAAWGADPRVALVYVSRSVVCSVLTATALVSLRQLGRSRSLLADLKDR